MLVPDEAVGALELEAFLSGKTGNAEVRGLSRVAVGTGHEMGLERALLWAATHSTPNLYPN